MRPPFKRLSVGFIVGKVRGFDPLPNVCLQLFWLIIIDFLDHGMPEQPTMVAKRIIARNHLFVLVEFHVVFFLFGTVASWSSLKTNARNARVFRAKQRCSLWQLKLYLIVAALVEHHLILSKNLILSKKLPLLAWNAAEMLHEGLRSAHFLCTRWGRSVSAKEYYIARYFLHNEKYLVKLRSLFGGRLRP